MSKQIRLLALLVATLALTITSYANAGKVSADSAKKRLKGGNTAYVGGQRVAPPVGPNQRKALVGGQAPFVTVITCSDSRVSPELMFNLGLGEIFVIRVAGNVVDVDELGSFEYGVEHLGTNLLLIMGHTNCGAVTATVQGGANGTHGNIPGLLSLIVPGVKAAQAAHPNVHGDDIIPYAIEENVWNTISETLKRSEIVSDAVEAGTLKVEGAVYELETGKVKWLGKHNEQSSLLVAAQSSHAPAGGQAPSGGGDSHDTSGGGDSHEEGGSSAGSTSEGESASANTTPIWLIGAGVALAIFFGVRLKAFQNFIANRKLAHKLAFGFGVALLGTAVVGGFGMMAKSQLYVEGEYLAQEIVPGMEMIADIELNALEARIQTLHIVHASSDEEMAGEAALIEANIAKVDASLANFDSIAHDPEEIKLLSEIEDQWDVQSVMLREVESLALDHKQAEAQVVEDAAEEHFESEFLPAIQALEHWGDGEAKFAANDLTRVNTLGTTKMIVVFVVVVLFIVMISMSITGLMTKAINELLDRMASLKDNCVTGLKASIDALKSGDLTVGVTPVTKPIEDCKKDEVGTLGTQFNGLLDQTQGMIESFTASQDSLKTMMRDLVKEATFVKESGNNVETAVGETAAASQQIASAMGEMSETVSQGASTSQQIAAGASDLASNATNASSAVDGMLNAIDKVKSGSDAQQTAGEEAGRTAKEGGEAVQQAISSMAKIQEQVELSNQAIKHLGEKQAQIGSIVNSIDEISEQTNLLALNAAIEAARAGEHGRGFAVVAEEVRKLAERAGASTSEIGEMITEINAGVEQAISSMQATSTEVEAGAEYSAKANEALKSILTAVDSFSHLAAQSMEQVEAMSSSAEAVNSSVDSVASISEETAAGAQELSAGNEEISASVEESSASIEEQTANIEQVNNMAKELASAADRLQSLAAQFKFEASAHGEVRLAAERDAA